MIKIYYIEYCLIVDNNKKTFELKYHESRKNGFKEKKKFHRLNYLSKLSLHECICSIFLHVKHI